MKKIRIWDLPLRIFHWSLVILVAAAIIAQKIGGNAMEWHFRFGYAVLALVTFRIVWGFVGSRYARFSNFVFSPSAVIAHLRSRNLGEPRTYLGHNPTGSLSVLAMLAVLLLQTISGLFSNDDIASEGPLAKLIDKSLSDQISSLHADVSGTLIYILIGLHIAAIAYYYFRKKENLVTPMITGDKENTTDEPSGIDSWRVRVLALAIFAVCAGGVSYVVTR